MKKQMCNEIYLTEREYEILEYVYSEGGFGVPVCPTVVKQNKNFYNRVKKLENNNLVIVQRYDGKASEFDITSQGREYVKLVRQNEGKIERETDMEFLISLIKSSSLSQDLKSKVISVLS